MGLFDASYSDVMAGTPRLSGLGAVPARSFGQLLSLLGEPLPGGDELKTSAMYRAGLLDAMAGGPTQGEFREGMRNRMANTALGLLGAIEPLYHGSPHKFSKFDLSKIGSGEGAQAYGHGAYLAERPGVAVDYARKLSRPEAFMDGKRVTYDPQAIDAKSLGLSAVENQGSVKEAIAGLKEAAADDSLWTTGSPYTGLRDAYKQAADWLEKNAKAITVDSGNLYEARLRWPDAAREASDPLGPQHFLDWDKPLSEQGADILKSLSKATGTPLEKYASDKRTGSQIWKTWISRRGSPEEASLALKDLGIPGLRYLDAGSRGAGAGTHNYVVFDDALIELLKRNGEAIGGLLGGK